MSERRPSSERAEPLGAPAEPGTLRWGRRYLLCPPAHFGVLYEINPWMHTAVRVDADRAQRQWADLVHHLNRAGAVVETLPPTEGLPDLVFTANVGFVSGKRFVASRFRHPQRAPESPYAEAWFRSRGYAVEHIPADGEAYFEGAGDALPFRGELLAGFRQRSSFAAHTALSRLLGVRVHSVELVDRRFYHVDLTFCPLDDRHAIVNPHGWNESGRALVRELVPEPLALELDEALTFCMNSVVVGRVVIMPHCPPRVGTTLERWGFDVCVSPVDEFLKAGGAVRCLTLPLDLDLGQHPTAPPDATGTH